MDYKHHSWIDTLRVLATIGVIILHVSSFQLMEYNATSLNLWWIGNIFNGTFRFSMPIFFMISGALLLSKDYTLQQFLKKRFIRIIPPFLFWSSIYILYTISIKIYHGESLHLVDISKIILRKLLFGAQYHLWFIYILIGCYLFIPIVRKWIKTANQKEILFFLSIWIFTIVFNYNVFSGYKPAIDLRYFSGAFGYLILGYFLSINKNLLLNKRWVALSFVFVGSLITILGTYFTSSHSQTFVDSFYVYLTPHIMLYSIGVFLLIKNIRIKNMFVLNAIHFISKHSFGIYLIHVLILKLLTVVGIHGKITHPIVSIPLVTIVCLILAMLIISTMKKIKIGRYIAG